MVLKPCEKKIKTSNKKKWVRVQEGKAPAMNFMAIISMRTLDSAVGAPA